ncbi:MULTISPECIES: hypothetical protein [Agrobacterium]|uniref:hypothetical protein n=1 Tax=Agrobacterium TaxID=357 RepID=UPI000D3D8460|nr:MULTISPECIES: hypothetical protein [Agrobacterium]PTV76389.1 hypothetical protein DBL06_07975 [Agrobacterium pusense]TZG36499.1 hypothetical protein AGR1_03090 [Agrobacterium sp. B1(2019)]
MSELVRSTVNIQSARLFEDVHHYCTYADGRVEEGWGLAWIAATLEKHFDSDQGSALQFFGRIHEFVRENQVEEEDQVSVEIRPDGEVVNIEIRRKGHKSIRYPNDFIFYESTLWAFEPVEETVAA